jgi:hypothetical protein
MPQIPTHNIILTYTDKLALIIQMAFIIYALNTYEAATGQKVVQSKISIVNKQKSKLKQRIKPQNP